MAEISLFNFSLLISVVVPSSVIFFLIKDDEISTTAISSKLVLPIQKSKQNPNMQKLVTNFGAQMIAYRYSNPDNNLVDCETFFNDNKSGIVPLAAAIPYFQRIHKESTKK